MEIDEHLAACAGCAEQEKNLRALRTAVSSPSLYYRAPEALRNRLQRTSAPAARPRASMRWLAMAAGILLMLGAAAAAGVFLSRGRTSADDRVAEWIAASHIRSLQVEHLTDVASADGHKVKPWFRGKLDFSPQVSDLSAEGYKLSGGRLDYLADRPVAALVYQRRLHAINLFTWPAANDVEKPVRGLDRQGFHIRHWQRSGMTYWAISDLNEQELDEFVRLVQRDLPDRG
jgi:anti-sigma factor RsiW